MSHVFNGLTTSPARWFTGVFYPSIKSIGFKFKTNYCLFGVISILTSCAVNQKGRSNGYPLKMAKMAAFKVLRLQRILLAHKISAALLSAIPREH